MKHVLDGVRDFLARYLAVFKAAWSVRSQLEPPARTADELAFLPAHLELIETPVSPTARWTMRTIIALFCLALTVFFFSPRLWILAERTPGSFEWDRGLSYMRQCADPFASDLEPAMRWRLLPPLTARVLGLRDGTGGRRDLSRQPADRPRLWRKRRGGAPL